MKKTSYRKKTTMTTLQKKSFLCEKKEVKISLNLATFARTSV